MPCACPADARRPCRDAGRGAMIAAATGISGTQKLGGCGGKDAWQTPCMCPASRLSSPSEITAFRPARHTRQLFRRLSGALPRFVRERCRPAVWLKGCDQGGGPAGKRAATHPWSGRNGLRDAPGARGRAWSPLPLLFSAFHASRRFPGAQLRPRALNPFCRPTGCCVWMLARVCILEPFNSSLFACRWRRRPRLGADPAA